MTWVGWIGVYLLVGMAYAVPVKRSLRKTLNTGFSVGDLLLCIFLWPPMMWIFAKDILYYAFVIYIFWMRLLALGLILRIHKRQKPTPLNIVKTAVLCGEFKRLDDDVQAFKAKLASKLKRPSK